ncbi:hypothetical protein KY092_06900 [Natronomonas gomsonensis]|jgi:hypothetical protein|uniref:hypothetical protein n=1 Tax=Natronomonas gomsonensis TaxID=1046043 RepID=UPI0020CA686A|nr:hypothetical protein [Natronomonas gomsonensis]MCY4730283.1 hypothetical protein [Natronomonas gomsonensis]
MDCSVCGADSELLYRCERCGQRLCATHLGHRYHDCARRQPADRPPKERTGEPLVERPDAQLYPERSVPSVEPPSPPGDIERPGYEPKRTHAGSSEPAETVGEWLRRQTYLSLTVKVGLLAAGLNTLAFALLGAALTLPA